MNFAVPGRIAVSKAGHDKGKAFIVLARNEDGTVLIADGKTRTALVPKRKKTMHLFITPVCAKEIKEKLESGMLPQDHEIRRALMDYNRHDD